jgi:hypothetical protein
MMGIPGDAFPITPAEKARIARLSSAGKSADEMEADWLSFAESVRGSLLQAYADQEISYMTLLRLSRNTSLGCNQLHRMQLLARAADDGLRTKRSWPHPRAPHKPKYPMALRAVACTLVNHYREQVPQPKLADCIKAAHRTLGIISLFPKQPKQSTLKRWYLDQRRASGTASPRGRPRKQRIVTDTGTN